MTNIGLNSMVAPTETTLSWIVQLRDKHVRAAKREKLKQIYSLNSLVSCWVSSFVQISPHFWTTSAATSTVELQMK